MSALLYCAISAPDAYLKKDITHMRYILRFFDMLAHYFYLGNITVGNVLEVLPFGNEIDLVTMKGSTILKALEKSVEGWDPIDQSGAFLHFSGMLKKRY